MKNKQYSEADIALFIDAFNKTKHEYEVNFTINGKPVPYARARQGRGGFYNPKQAVENAYKREFKKQLHENYPEIESVLFTYMKDDSLTYYVEIEGNFYVPIQAADSVKTALLKEHGIIKPAIRNGDVDNYMKLVLDALHDVIYTDDKLVVGIKANKLYSSNPRSEIKIKITTY